MFMKKVCLMQIVLFLSNLDLFAQSDKEKIESKVDKIFLVFVELNKQFWNNLFSFI